MLPWKNILVLGSVAGLLLGVTGCGGSPQGNLLREGTNIFSELADALRKVVGNESAQRFLGSQGKNIQAKMLTNRTRLEGFVRFSEKEDLELMSMYWAANLYFNEGDNTSPISKILKNQASIFARHVENEAKVEFQPSDTKPWPFINPLSEADVPVYIPEGGKKKMLRLKRVDALIEREKNLFAESKAAKILLDQQMARIKKMEPSGPTDEVNNYLKMFLE